MDTRLLGREQVVEVMVALKNLGVKVWQSGALFGLFLC